MLVLQLLVADHLDERPTLDRMGETTEKLLEEGGLRPDRRNPVKAVVDRVMDVFMGLTELRRQAHFLSTT